MKKNLQEDYKSLINFIIEDKQSRKCIALDINDEAINLAKKNKKFNLNDMSANIIHYTNKKEGDLSFCNIDEFLREMEEVARESYRIRLKKVN